MTTSTLTHGGGAVQISTDEILAVSPRLVARKPGSFRGLQEGGGPDIHGPSRVRVPGIALSPPKAGRVGS